MRGEKHRCERETLTGCLWHVPLPETEPATQACALTGNRTGDPLHCDVQPNRTSLGRTKSFLSSLKFLLPKIVLLFISLSSYTK